MFVEIAEAIKKYAPDCWVINYTNPMSLCCLLYTSMKNPDRAATLFARNEKEAKERYEHLSKLVALYGND